MFQVIFVTVISAVVAIGFIFYSTPSDDGEEEFAVEIETKSAEAASSGDAA